MANSCCEHFWPVANEDLWPYFRSMPAGTVAPAAKGIMAVAKSSRRGNRLVARPNPLFEVRRRQTLCSMIPRMTVCRTIMEGPTNM